MSSISYLFLEVIILVVSISNHTILFITSSLQLISPSVLSSLLSYSSIPSSIIFTLLILVMIFSYHPIIAYVNFIILGSVCLG